jgi:amino acid adenylation domain-containing protein
MTTLTDNPAHLFQASAHRFPTKTALVWKDGELTYETLRRRIEALRDVLDLSGTSPFVGILAHKSPAAYAAVQAILAQGGTYVPLNPGFPPTRNAYILRKADVSSLVVGEECAQALEALLPLLEHPLRILAQEDAVQVRALAAAHPEKLTLVDVRFDGADASRPLLPPAKVAYVLFTSGSTGEPKGVQVRPDNVLSYVRSLLSLYPITSEDRLSQTFDLTFDLSVHDQFVTWATGATLVSFPDEALLSPLEWTRSTGVTVWFSVPSLAAFLDSSRQVVPNALPDVRLSLFCGEKLTWKTCQVWRTVAPNSRQANLYGPTEATIAITHFEIAKDFPEAKAFQGGIPIGHAYPGQKTEVRREDGSLCETGETGGLWLGGNQVTSGYIGEPEKTAARFVERDGELWYRTGDLVFEDPDVGIQYVGREDFQVKVMGYRIELGEIEHALLQVSGATFALADVAARDGADEIFAVLPEACAVRKKEIKAAVKDRLPSYMAPRRYLFTDDIPLNANGKMDRGALKARMSA